MVSCPSTGWREVYEWCGVDPERGQLAERKHRSLRSEQSTPVVGREPGSIPSVDVASHRAQSVRTDGR